LERKTTQYKMIDLVYLEHCLLIDWLFDCWCLFVCLLLFVLTNNETPKSRRGLACLLMINEFLIVYGFAYISPYAVVAFLFMYLIFFFDFFFRY